MTIELLVDLINERVKELMIDLSHEANRHDNNHIASIINGEIDGLNWVLDLLGEDT